MRVCILSTNPNPIKLICDRNKWDYIHIKNSLSEAFNHLTIDLVVVDFNNSSELECYITGFFMGCGTTLVGIAENEDNVMPNDLLEYVFILTNEKDLEHAMETIAMAPKCTPEEAMRSWGAGGH